MAWLHDGSLVFTTGGSELLEMPVSVGAARPLFLLDSTKEVDVHDVSALPDSQSLLYVVHTVSGPWTIESLRLADSSRRTLYTAVGSPLVTTPVYSSTGHVVFERQGSLWALPLPVCDQQPTGEPSRVLSDARRPTVARDGTLVMLAGGLETDTMTPKSGTRAIERVSDRHDRAPRRCLTAPRSG